MANFSARPLSIADVLLIAGDRFADPRGKHEPKQAFRANATGPGILSRACADAKLPPVHISTDYVFDGAKTAAYSEQDARCPLGVYGRSKAAGETAIRETLEPHLILRTSWVYGEYGANFLKIVLELACTRNELRIVTDQRGCPTGTADLACAILKIAPRLADRDLIWGTYHFLAAVLLPGIVLPRKLSMRRRSLRGIILMSSLLRRPNTRHWRGVQQIQNLTRRVLLQFSVFGSPIGVSEHAKWFQLC
jgi:hypothetical protein